MTLELDSSSGHRDSHEAGTTTTDEDAGASEGVAPELETAIRDETVRLFLSTRWLAPIGNVAAAIVLVLATHGMLAAGPRNGWLAATVAVQPEQFALFRDGLLAAQARRPGDLAALAVIRGFAAKWS